MVLTCAACGRESAEGTGFCPACGAPLGSPTAAREVRKTVTVLFCDLTGSTELGETLDPERLRRLLASYFERMKAVVERHGGSVEKFIGDAVMAVFGVPVLHEDDAVRAVRAAAEMRDVLPDLGLRGRIGVMTGEVVTGTDERLATGDAVNVAARLEQAAQPGEVLVGEPTLSLVRNAADVEPIEPLDVKGKSAPVPAYRLLRVHDAPERRRGKQFVGRDRELAILQDAWGRVRAERRCTLVTIVGDAGVGKSRLASELLASIETSVFRGRCLPYGEGITYWPVVEVLKQIPVLPPDEAAARAIRSLLGEEEVATSAEEIAWGFRKTLEHAAAERPMVIVFDDIHWGEETFLNLIEHVALLSSGASILLLCMARPELGEHRPTWPVTLRLEPLRDEDVDELIPGQIPLGLRERIARAAGGNPLYVEEMLSMAGEADDEVIVPPTLQALLAARLDQLGTAERRILERGAIEGEIFHRGAVQALAPEETQVTPRLAALVRKDLIRPDTPMLLGDDGFRFRHLLIRDAAYDALSKAARADLHERFASWLEEHGTELVELDEILGYHLEQACHYRRELGLPADELAGMARRRLAAAGLRAQLRQDYAAAVSLIVRASALVPPDEIDLAVETELAEALIWTGRSDEALRRAENLVERASQAGDRVGELCGRMQAGIVRLYFGTEGATSELAALVEESMPLLEDSGDDLALYVGWTALAEVASTRALMDEALEAVERALSHARRAGHLPAGSLGSRAACRFFGTTPVSRLLGWLDENEPRTGRDHFLRAYRAGALGMLGRFDEARAILADSRAEAAERGAGVLLANLTAFEAVDLELWAGDADAAAEFAAEGYRLHEEMGEELFLAGAAGNRARALYALGRFDEADEWAGRAGDLGASDDAQTEMLWRRIRAKVSAHRGEHAEAERLAREAVAICDGTEMLDAQADVYADLGEVLLLDGREEEAAAAFGQALGRYEQKENLVMAARTREQLEVLRGEVS
jgi:class 3 adenylate cyclase/tetratricopeptide (TPR) repeat protein